MANGARISGLEKSEAPWHLRWFYRAMRRMFGRDLTPVKLQMRVPGIVWGSIGMERVSGASDVSRSGCSSSQKSEPRRASDAHFEST